MLVDSHCHLDFPQFADDFDGVLSRAAEAGVGTMLTISTSIARFPGVLEVARRSPALYASVGVHPHEAGAEPDVTVDDLLERTRDPKVIGIGETGLDYFYEHSPREAQIAGFRRHIAAARETGLPLIVHTRDADEDTVAILADETGKGAFPFLIHCFSSSGWLAKECLALGGYISVSGIVTFKKAEALRETIAEVPLDRILVETDAPYLAPVPYRGKTNEPAFVAHTAAAVAHLKTVDEETVARQTTDTFFQLFSKAYRPQ
ncbi:MAG: TatD family hydrolase [Alphaproteobacteria bacterium]|nr:TatD family hydrolase [Alphaproteobacteria bacterium]MDX5370330.1 TatD family hydrolase [Alphaproteobacteria bacterium]MDX5464868.1 TatD family hydrolase [Alphaproteobacteria bacterium]